MDKRETAQPELQADKQTATDKKARLRMMLRRLAPFLLLRLLLPFVLYQVAGLFFPASETLKLGTASLVPVIMVSIKFMRKGRLDLLSIFILGGLALSLVWALFTQDIRFLSLRAAFLVGLFGVVGLISLAFPQPLAYAIYQDIITDGDATQDESQLWQVPVLLAKFRSVTAIAGSGLLIVMIVDMLLVFFVVPASFQLFTPIFAFGCGILLLSWAGRSLMGALLNYRV